MMDTSFREIAALRWTPDRAWSWYNGLPWLVGCNFAPSCAGNQLEMWQAETFAPDVLDRELGWLAGLGMNTVRVFLHDLLWDQDAAGFLQRIDTYLSIAERHGIGTMFVFFDSCWHPFPRLGPQPPTEPGVHNSLWLQSPGLWVLYRPETFGHLEAYVSGVVSRFANDPRVHCWDVWNEPDNNNAGSYASREFAPGEKAKVVLPLLAEAFRWVRSANPSQPVISGIWNGDWTTHESLDALSQFQMEASDLTSFHRYVPLEETKRDVALIERYQRPLLCTEYMARPAGSTFEAILPYFQEQKIAAYNWGAVAGRIQTQHGWATWRYPDAGEPEPWFHDILRPDGTAYDPKEAALLRRLTGRGK